MKWPVSKLSTVRAAFGVILISGLVACASGPQGTPEEQVRASAESRWELLIAGKIEDAYKLTPPSYRKENSFESYRSKIGGTVKWTGAEVISVKCTQESCDARLRIDAHASIGIRYSGPISTAVDERWVNEDGRWWFLPAN